MDNIPENADKVFSGILFDVYQWPQTLYDGKEVTFEAVSRRPTVQVIAVKGDEIVLLHEEQPMKALSFNLIGG
ncbi:MAG: hypothetical protein ACHQUB_02375, partial [Candidatus Saccharimonadia bacterium]